MEKTIHQQELEARIKGLSEEDKEIVARCLPLELLLSVVVRKSLAYKTAYNEMTSKVKELEDKIFLEIPRGITMS